MCAFSFRGNASGKFGSDDRQLDALELRLSHDRQMGLGNCLGRASGLRAAPVIDAYVVFLAERLFLTGP
jgi:hypothetical protein